MTGELLIAVALILLFTMDIWLAPFLKFLIRAYQSVLIEYRENPIKDTYSDINLLQTQKEFLIVDPVELEEINVCKTSHLMFEEIYLDKLSSKDIWSQIDALIKESRYQFIFDTSSNSGRAIIRRLAYLVMISEMYDLSEVPDYIINHAYRDNILHMSDSSIREIIKMDTQDGVMYYTLFKMTESDIVLWKTISQLIAIEKLKKTPKKDKSQLEQFICSETTESNLFVHGILDFIDINILSKLCHAYGTGEWCNLKTQYEVLSITYSYRVFADRIRKLVDLGVLHQEEDTKLFTINILKEDMEYLLCIKVEE